MDFITSMKLQYVQMLNALKTEDGQTFAEYALIFALVVIVAMAGLAGIGTGILTQFQAVAAQL